MTELKTLKEIFETEPDHAEIFHHTEPDKCFKVSEAKDWVFSGWEQLNFRTWIVRRTPREFEALELKGSLYPTFWNFVGNVEPKPIKVREVLEGE